MSDQPSPYETPLRRLSLVAASLAICAVMIGTGSILSRSGPVSEATVTASPEMVDVDDEIAVEGNDSEPDAPLAFTEVAETTLLVDGADLDSSPSVPAPTLRPRPTEVLLIGDSIAREVQPSLSDEMSARGIGFDAITFPGMAACDLMKALELHMATASPDVVLVLFTGNAITPCMADASDPTSDAYFETYRSDVTQMVALVGGESVDIWLVGTLPYAQASTVVSTLRLGETLASIDGVDGTIEISDLFVDEGGDYGADLPCRLPEEPCPTVRVRASDGIHLGDDGTNNIFGRERLTSGITRFVDAIYQ